MLRSSVTRLAPLFGIVLLGLTSAIFIACVGGSGEDSASSEDEICGTSSGSSGAASGFVGYGGYGYGGYGYSSSSTSSSSSGSGRPCRER